MNNLIFSAGCALLNGKVYVMGGVDPDIHQFFPTQAVDVYDPATDSWSSSSPMLEARAVMGEQFRQSI